MGANVDTQQIESELHAQLGGDSEISRTVCELTCNKKIDTFALVKVNRPIIPTVRLICEYNARNNVNERARAISGLGEMRMGGGNRSLEPALRRSTLWERTCPNGECNAWMWSAALARGRSGGKDAQARVARAVAART